MQQGDKPSELPDAAQSLGAKGTGLDLSKLTPAPWMLGVAGNSNLVHFNGDDIVGIANMREPNAEFCALARNAFDVMMRRGWSARPDDDRGWWVEATQPDGIIACGGPSWPDPFTALVESERWYVAKRRKDAAMRLRADAEQREAALQNEARAILAKLDTLERGIAAIRSQRDELLAALRNLMAIQDCTDDCWCVELEADFEKKLCEACVARAAIARGDAGGEGKP